MDGPNLIGSAVMDEIGKVEEQPKAQSVLKRRLLIAAEVALVIIIVGLLVLTWLPAFIGARPGVMPSR
jgi:hypothetical protein